MWFALSKLRILLGLELSTGIYRFASVPMQPAIQMHHANCLCFSANMCKHEEVLASLAHIDSNIFLFWNYSLAFGIFQGGDRIAHFVKFSAQLGHI